MSETKVTDAALGNVSVIVQLEKLDLSDTGITDRGILLLQTLNQLKELRIRNTKVTDDAVGQLQMLLPNCKTSRQAPVVVPRTSVEITL